MSMPVLILSRTGLRHRSMPGLIPQRFGVSIMSRSQWWSTISSRVRTGRSIGNMWRGLFDRIIRLSAYTNDGLGRSVANCSWLFGFLRGNEMNGIDVMVHTLQYKAMLKA